MNTFVARNGYQASARIAAAGERASTWAITGRADDERAIKETHRPTNPVDLPAKAAAALSANKRRPKRP
jgi:hypothetical protein